MKIIIPQNTKVCFSPKTGEETILKSDLIIADASWGVNGNPGWVFNYMDGQPTAYCLEWERITEINISLTNDIDQKNPLAFLVFCFNDLDNDYMIFTEETGAKDYAMQQEELADYPEGTWPVYPLYAGEKLKFLI